MNTISPLDLKKAAQSLPPSPKIFGKLGRLLKDPNTEVEQIKELVNTDSSLTANVLRLSNSAMYSSGEPVDNLEDAVGRIGFRELYKLVGMAAANQMFADFNSTYGVEGATLWENSLACGLGMEILARKTGHDEQEAYTLGLLRNMGKMVIDHCSKQDPDSPQYPKGSQLPLIDWEENNFGITNPTVAGFILQSWNFTDEVAHTIQYQYLPEEAPRKLAMINLLNLSNGLAERLGKGLPGESSYWTDWKTRLPRTGLSIDELKEGIVEIKEQLDKVVSSVV